MKTDRATVIERANAASFPADTRDLLLALLAEKEATEGELEAVYVTAEKHAIALADARTKLAARKETGK